MRSRKMIYMLLKKSMLLIIILLISMINVYANDKNIQAQCVDFNININGETQKIENNIFVINGRTYLPLREISECLDLYVSWDAEEKIIKISQIGLVNSSEKSVESKNILEIVNVNEADFKVKINGYEKTLENPIIVYDDISYLPVREIAELLTLRVDWIDITKTVAITAQDNKICNEEFLLPFNIENDELDYVWGYMDKYGNVIVEPKYEEVGDFSDGRAYVLGENGKNYGYGFIDVKGEEIIPCNYVNAFNFSEGLAAAGTFSENNNVIEYKFIDKSGNIAIDKVFYRETYEDMEFHNGFAPVTKLNEYNEKENIYINKYGEEVANFKKCKISNFQNGFAVVEDRDNNDIKIINTKFETVIDFKESGYDTTDGSYIMGNGFLTLRNNTHKWGVVDYNNKLIIPFDYDYMNKYSEGVFAVGKHESGNMEYGFVDLNENLIISNLNNIADNFYNGVSFTLNNYESDDMQVSIINKSGKYIKENINIGIWTEPNKNIYPEGIRAFFKDKKKIYVDANGNCIKPKY